MRLTELSPKFFTVANEADGLGGHIYLGLTFLCPHCRVQRLGVMFEPVIDTTTEQWSKKGISFPTGLKWRREGDTFETLSLSPSIDASRTGRIDFDGHWHGHIKNGEVT